MRKFTLRTMMLSLMLALVCGLGIVLAGCGDEPSADTYTVTFDTDGGTTIAPVEWTAGTPLTVEEPTKAKHDFAGWYYDGEHTDEADLSDLHAEGDFTLYAKWTYVPQTYTVTFDTDGGTDIDSVQWTEGTVLTVEEPTKPKHDFAGWFYDAEGEEEADLSDLHAEGNFTLYAKWTYIPQTYTVTFDTDGGTNIESKSWTEGTTLTVTAPTKKRHDFAGWYYDDGCTDEADLSNLHAEGNFTLHAKWDYVLQTYPVTFETHGGSTVTATTWKEGEALTVTAPARGGYDFAGWYFDADYENEANLTELPVQGAEVTSLTLHAKWNAKEWTITLYPDHDGNGQPTVKKYKTDETVDPAQWEKPTLTHEGDAVPFLHWETETGDETYEPDATFTMPAKNLALYPVFDMPQLFNWTYDPATKTYTSTGGGLRPVKDCEGFYYGTLSADFEVAADSNVNGLGLIWNAVYSEDDYPFGKAGDVYHYLHLNPQSGGFQYARADGNLSAPASYAATTYVIGAAPQAWQTKWAAWNAARSTDEKYTLTFTLKAEFTPTGFNLYIDNDKLASYTGEYVNALTGKKVGLRANGAGIVAKNVTASASQDYPDSVVHIVSFVSNQAGITFAEHLYAEGTPVANILPHGVYEGYEFTWYTDASYETPASGNSLSSYILYGRGATVELKNGFKVYEDKYVVNSATGVPVLAAPVTEARTGKFSATFTATKNTGKIGLMFNAAIPESSDLVSWENTEVDGYVIYINIGAITSANKAYFTLNHIANGAYDKKSTDDELKDLFINYWNYAGDGAGFGVLTMFYDDIVKMREGQLDSVTFTLTLTVTETRIALSLNDCMLFVRPNPTSDKTYYHAGTKWGVYAGQAGTWSDFEYETVSEKNGYIVTKDGAGKPVYTSAPLTTNHSIATLVDGLEGQYGKLEATLTVSNVRNGRLGLLINANLTDAPNGGELDWAEASVGGYFLYHNFRANANFTIAAISQTQYYSGGGRAYAAATDSGGALNAEAPQQLKDYHAKVVALLEGKAESVTVKIGIEITKEHVINVYVDDLLYHTSSTFYATRPELANFTKVGLVTSGTGTVFSNITFVPAAD